MATDKQEMNVTDDAIVDDAIVDLDNLTVQSLTATELADEIGVHPKAFRSFYRSYAKRNGLATPGSGARYRFNVTEADIAAWSAEYHAHRKANNALTVDGSPIG
jgi:hypothetical protein